MFPQPRKPFVPLNRTKMIKPFQHLSPKPNSTVPQKHPYKCPNNRNSNHLSPIQFNFFLTNTPINVPNNLIDGFKYRSLRNEIGRYVTELDLPVPDTRRLTGKKE